MEGKRRSLLWIVVASCFLTAVILFVLFRFMVAPPAKADIKAKPLYTIGVWEGTVAVFEGDNTYPKHVYDMPVSGLPQELRRQVMEGVPVYSEAELSLLLEDYTG